MVSDDLLGQAQRHIAADHDRDARLDAVRRYAEALASDSDPVRRAVGVELIQIVGQP